MTLEETLARRAFYAARDSLARLKEPREDGSIYLNRFAEVEAVRFASGTGVQDVRPAPRSASWTDFCAGVSAYASVVIGETEDDKRSQSKYIVAGEVVRTVAVAVGGLSAEPSLESFRSDVDVRSITMLVLDCDAPVASAPLCRALESLTLAYCVAPTWASSVASPRWRCFLPVAPIAVDSTERGRVQARVRYAWLAGLLSELAGLPRECPSCDGTASGFEDAESKRVCPACLGDGKFRFDLSCWNYSRLHFVGGRKSASVSMEGREVRWGRGYGIDCAAWLEGSGFGEFWVGCVAELDAADAQRAGTRRSPPGLPSPDVDGLADGLEELHPDAEIASAMASTDRTLLERVRRAALYIGSPDFPASCKAGHDPRFGHDDLMRACSAVVSGFLVPLELGDEEWAQRVIETVYNPRCADLDGEPHPWTAREIRKKLRDVRATQGGNGPGHLLARRSGEGDEFYVVLADGSQGQPVDMAGVYSARGEQLSSVTRSGALLELSIDAAIACPVRPYDPRVLPEGFRPRKTVLSMNASADRRAGETIEGVRSAPRQLSAVGSAMVSAQAGTQVASTAGPTVGKLQIVNSSPGLSSDAVRSQGGSSAGSGLDASSGIGRRARSRIPLDHEWTVPVEIDVDDERAKRMIVEQMNKRLAYVQLPRDAVIVDTAANKARGKGERAFMTLRGFFHDQARYPVRLKTQDPKTGREKTKDVNRAEIWLASPHRRQYSEWGFAPELTPEECERIDPETGSRRLLNTFQGFPVKPSDEGLSAVPRFAELVNEVIADGREEWARYLWVWLADLFQRPADKQGVALYLHSPEKGTGKGTFFDVVGRLLGRYYLLVQSADQVAGQWNLHLADKLLVFFDETRGLEGRDKADRLASLITESEFAAAEKFMPLQSCRSYARFAFSANREDGVSIQVQDRRYAAFKVSSRRLKDVAFFRALRAELYAPLPVPPSSAAVDPALAAAGTYRGLSALMGHMLWGVAVGGEGTAEEGRPELGGAIEIRSIPRTDLRMSMMFSSLEGMEAFVFYAACQAQHLGFARRDAAPPERCPCATCMRCCCAKMPALSIGLAEGVECPNLGHGRCKCSRRAEQVGVPWSQDGPFSVTASDFSALFNDWARAHRVEGRAPTQIWRHLEAVFTIADRPAVSSIGSVGSLGSIGGAAVEERHPDFRRETVEEAGRKFRVYWLPAGPAVYAWLARKYGW